MRQKFIIYAHQRIVRIMCMVMFGALTVPGATWAQTLAAGSIESLQRLSIEELANLQVTSVAKIPESLHEAPAAVYVITHDDIIRSGARRIPDMLRLAPNLEVFQTSPDNYVITARGLSGSSSAQNVPNKIEVPIDGRSVNSLLYSGVYLDMQNVLPENIDRNPDFQPEKLTAFEVGDRAEFGNASVSVSGFYNLYTDLRSIEFSQNGMLPLLWGSGMEGHVYGVGSWGGYQPLPWWRLDAGLTLQHEHPGFVPGASELLGVAQAGDDPHTQARLRSSMELGKSSFDADFRYVGMLPDPAVPAYVEWTIPPAEEIPRMVYLELRQSV